MILRAMNLLVLRTMKMRRIPSLNNSTELHQVAMIKVNIAHQVVMLIMMTTQIWPLHQTPELRNHLNKRNLLMRSPFMFLKTEPKEPVNNMGVQNNNNLTRYTTHPLMPGKAEQEGVLGEVQGEDKMEVDEEVTTVPVGAVPVVDPELVDKKTTPQPFMEPLLRPWPPLLNMGPRPLPCPPTVSMMHCLHMVTEDLDRPLILCQFTFLAPLATKMGDPFMPIIMSDSQFYSKSKITGGIYYPYLTIYYYLSSVFSYYSRFCYSSF